MQSRTRGELPLFRTVHGLGYGHCGRRHLVRLANYEEKQTVVGNKTARNVFRGQCAENC
jgi:hypothetical protein